MTEQETNGKGKNDKLFKIVAALLLIALIVIGYMMINTKSELKELRLEKEAQRFELQGELDALMSDHEMIKSEYGVLADSMAIKDSIIQANAGEIKSLLNTKYEYYKVKKKLKNLRTIAQGYLHQIDSLYTVNRELTEENIQIKQQFKKEQLKVVGLNKDKELLNEKVSMASVLKAYQITAQALRVKTADKERVTDKARRVEYVKVCFTLSENNILAPGQKELYVRIADPNNQILAYGSGDEYAFQYKGETLQYSTHKSVAYQNESLDLCMYWKNRGGKDALIAGKYVVTVFEGDNEIGQSYFMLR